jgi:hypothetical protein
MPSTIGQPDTWGDEQAVTITDTRLYGKATAQAWDRLHPRLTRRAAWLGHGGPLPIIEGTVIRLTVEKLPSTWLVIAAHTQLRIARPLAADLRRPWERKAEPNKLTPSRVRRGFRNLRGPAPAPSRLDPPVRHTAAPPTTKSAPNPQGRLTSNMQGQHTERMRYEKRARLTVVRALVPVAILISSPVLLMAGALEWSCWPTETVMRLASRRG